jgi:hypothetical protein
MSESANAADTAPAAEAAAEDRYLWFEDVGTEPVRDWVAARAKPSRLK